MFLQLSWYASFTEDATGSGIGLAKRSHMPTAVTIRITLSIGVSIFKDHNDSIDDIIKRADIALYKAKETDGKIRRAAQRGFAAGRTPIQAKRDSGPHWKNLL